MKHIAAAFVILLTSLTAAVAQAQFPSTLCWQTESGSPPRLNCTTGLAPVTSTTSASSLVIKAAPGTLFDVSATNLTATAGHLMAFDATSAPADGAVTPKACVPLAGAPTGTARIEFGPGPGMAFGTGIVAVISNGGSCYNKVTTGMGAFIRGVVQ